MNNKKLAEKKAELLAIKADLLAELNKSRNGLHDHQGADDRADFTDLSSIDSDRDFQLRLNERDVNLLKKIDETLAKVENKTYGVCEDCGQDIAEKRLAARPVVSLCIDCKVEQEHQEQRLALGL